MKYNKEYKAVLSSTIREFNNNILVSVAEIEATNQRELDKCLATLSGLQTKG
jgi:enolase